MTKTNIDSPRAARSQRPSMMLTLLALALCAFAAHAQEQKKDAPKASDDELKAAKKVQDAPDAAARMQAAQDFVKKYSKSSLRPQVGQVVIAKIADVPDAAQRTTMLENLVKLFNNPNETKEFTPFLVDEYVKADRHADAFKVGSAYISANDDDVAVRAQLAIVGVMQAQKQNAAYAQQSMQYAAKGIEMIEADKKPANLTDAQWGDYKVKVLAQLYQASGLFGMMTGDPAAARAKLEKASKLNPSDPMSFALLGNVLNDEYQQLAKQYQAANGAAKDEALKKAQDKMDSLIDVYAQAIAVADGKPEYKNIHDQLRQDIEPYYKFRHNGSTDGLQQLIDKYKAAAAATTPAATPAAAAPATPAPRQR